MRTIKEALSDGSLSLEDEIDYNDTPPAEEIALLKLEIERLNKRIEDLNIINEEHQILNGMLRKENKRLNNIIKEVREYIEDLYDVRFTDKDKRKILEILDKGE